MNFLFFSYNTREEFPQFSSTEISISFQLAAFRGGKSARRATMCSNARFRTSRVDTPATRIFAFRGERVFPPRVATFFPLSSLFFPSIPARSVCRSSALIASKNVGRARVPRNVPMIFRPPNSHLSLTGHATNKISPAPPREIADAENTVSSRFCSPPPLILQEQDGEVRVIERFN